MIARALGRAFLVLCILAATITPLSAQVTTAMILGTVKDSSGDGSDECVELRQPREPEYEHPFERRRPDHVGRSDATDSVGWTVQFLG